MIYLLAFISFTAPQFVYSANSCSAIYGTSVQGRATDIYIKEKQGAIEEHSLRQGQTAAHIYMDSSVDPYLFTAFPAGNSGVALWMRSPQGKAHLEALGKPRALQREAGLNGVEVQVRSGVPRLEVADSVLGSMRFIRDRELGMSVPAEVSNQSVRLENGVLVFERPSLNGLFRYVMEIEPIGGTRIVRSGDSFALISAHETSFKYRAFTSETPVTPLSVASIFKDTALKTMDPKMLEAFSFLFYKEKLVAGSPRYLSKFGRDSIYTLNVMMDVMKPEAIEMLLTATLSSLHPTKGLVSHEQNEGDFVSYVRLKRHERYKGVTQPMEDYKMIDDDFAFAIVLAKYMKAYPDRVESFLNRADQRGYQQRNLVRSLFRYVSRSTMAFAQKPVFQNLIGLKGHEKTGEWRDSENGLGEGKYPFDVNAALVPAALKELADLTEDPNSEFHDARSAASLRQAYQVWNSRALPLFMVRVPADRIEGYGSSYLRDLRIDPSDLPQAPRQDLTFPAISLDENGRPIPIMHSDDSLMMTFGHPTLGYLRTVSQRLRIQFPYGLATPVGILVANPIFASKDLQRKFDETKYHGRVSWKMQEDLLIYGIDRQLSRPDLPADLRMDLMRSQEAVRKVSDAKSSMGGTEVFSIIYRDRRYQAVPFAGDAKSNSNQLWSHLPLAFPSAKPEPRKTGTGN